MVAVLALALAAGDGCGRDDGGPPIALRVAAAASLTGAFTVLGDRFEADHPGIEVVLDFGASSDLARAIEEGAPTDVFASADERTMDQLVSADLVDGAPSAFARNRPEIAVPAGNPGSVHGLDDLAREELLVGLCAVDVPCGRLARLVLRNAGVAASVDTEEVDVKALVTRIAAGELDAGIVYHSDVVAAGDRVVGIPVADRSALATYPVATLADAPHPAAAAAFASYLSSPSAGAVLQRAGFLPPP